MPVAAPIHTTIRVSGIDLQRAPNIEERLDHAALPDRSMRPRVACIGSDRIGVNFLVTLVSTEFLM
jgi:hypothetical protein